VVLEDFPEELGSLPVKLSEILVLYESISETEDLLYLLAIIVDEKGKVFGSLPIHIDIKENNNLKDIEEQIKKDILQNMPPGNEELNRLFRPVFMEISRVIVNFLLYINHVYDDVLEVNTAPESLIRRLEYYKKEGKTRKIQRTQEEINKYTKLRIVGIKTADYYHKEIQKAGGSKRPHWRRGHIRYYDPNKERKRKFKKEWTYVRPALVGKGGKEDDNERIYIL